MTLPFGLQLVRLRPTIRKIKSYIYPLSLGLYVLYLYSTTYVEFACTLT